MGLPELRTAVKNQVHGFLSLFVIELNKKIAKYHTPKY